MKLKKPIVTHFNLNSTSEKPNIISIAHTDDKEVDFIELVLHQDLIRIDLTGSTAVARMVWEENNVLASDNVACTINDYGNILIPFDSAAIPLHSGILKIEINVTQDGKVFTLQTPLRVRFNPSILDNAEVTPDSKGTIPELLEEVKEQLERVEGFVDADEVNEIIDSKGYAAAIANKQDKLGIGNKDELVDVSSAGEMKRSGYSVSTNKNVISTKDSANKFIPNAKAIAEYVEEHSGGTSNYNDLENKPSINGIELNGNKTSGDLALQDKLTAGNGITIDTNHTIKLDYYYNYLQMMYGQQWASKYTVDQPRMNTFFYANDAVFGSHQNLPENKDCFVFVFATGLVSDMVEIAVVIESKNMYIRTATNGAITKVWSEWKPIAGGTSDYSKLENKPSINGKTIEGNLTTADFNLKDGKDGKSIIGAEIIMGDLYLWIEVENEAGEKFIERKHIGRVVGANGTNGKNGDGYSAAEINANGDLILTVLTGDGQSSKVNLGHVVGADGANGKDGKDGAKGDKGDKGDDYVLTAQDKSDIANIVLSELPTTQGVLYGNTSN